MNRQPANSLATDFMIELTHELQKLENEGFVRGVILASSCKNIFCAGLDLMALAGGTPDSLRKFWTAHQDLWLTLYGSPMATVAAMEGAAPAAGCMLAMACDHRIMAPKFAIGLNEAKFGLIAPTWMQQNMVNIVGHRQADRLMTRGLLLEAHDALKIGLVDQVAPQEEVLAAAERELLEMISVSDKARAMTKSALRFDSLSQLKRMKEMDQDWFIQFILQPDVQKALAAYIEAVKNRKKR
eukprot:CAMPEP_0196757426 /NCGR_PEP_ID=MMETSP1091-20130531/103657_1 /TAXON_ID=302021 /ORGANISM="Rhodomonas sp., Strain CCMP768" /LENGTH=240 /DNA_ID=CAMNT_0042106201 /DNA_START=186 /DNA_END=908 /DNA_ORIENTATION=-